MRLAMCDSVVPMEGRGRLSVVSPERHPDSNRLALSARRAIMRARTWLLSNQHDSGYWVGEQEGNTTTESETILLLAFFDREQDTLGRRCAIHLIEKQRDDGGWSAYPGGALDISISVKAYFALKLIGEDPSSEPMQRARRAILAHGGADAVDPLTRFFLAIMGQIPYDVCPVVPPEFETLSIVASRRPVHPFDPRQGIRELFLKKPEKWPSVERLLPEKHQKLLPMMRFLQTDDRHGFGNDHGSIVWSLIALKCLDFEDKSSEIRNGFEQLDALTLDDDQSGSTRFQPSQSPVRDTSIAIEALCASGTSHDNRALSRAVDWLLDQNDAMHVDSFETASVLVALGRQFAPTDSGNHLPPELQVITPESNRPHNSQQQATTEQQVTRIARTTKAIEDGLHHLLLNTGIQGQVLEGLGVLGRRQGDRVVDRIIDDLNAIQQADGSWLGHRGILSIHGTSQVIRGLKAVGVSSEDPVLASGVNWLLAHQQPCGGWGESPDACDEPARRGQGTPTASQTAWALMGLLDAELDAHPAVARGVQFLIDRQRSDGTWDEAQFTASDDSRTFFFRNSHDSICFPLMALSRWIVSESAAMVEVVPPKLRIVHPDEDVCWEPRIACVP